MEIYFGKDGQVLGPYREEEIRTRLEDDCFDGTEFAWHKGLDEWVNVKELLEGEDEPAEYNKEKLSGLLDDFMIVKNIEHDSEEWNYHDCGTLDEIKEGILEHVNHCLEYNNIPTVHFEDEEGNKYSADLMQTVEITKDS